MNPQKPDKRKKLPQDIKSQSERFRLCLASIQRTYNYEAQQSQLKQKEAQIRSFYVLQQMTTSPKLYLKYILPNISAIFLAIQKKLFRPLKPLINTQADPQQEEEDKQSVSKREFNPLWPILQAVYSLLFDLIMSFESLPSKKSASTSVSNSQSQLKHFITPSFLSSLLQIFNSDDYRQRDILRSILHKIYSVCVQRRKLIRKFFNQLFYDILYERVGEFKGILQILQIISSIVAGYAVPLREQHVIAYKKIIIPLLKVPEYISFYPQLNRCISLYLSKDCKLVMPLIEGLFKYWPFANSEKQLLFLDLLRLAVSYGDINNCNQIRMRVIKRVAKCLEGDHIHTKDRAMLFFDQTQFISLVKGNSDQAQTQSFEILAPIIEKQSYSHWYPLMTSNFKILQEIMKQVDKQLYTAKSKLIENSIEKKRSEMDARWAEIEKRIVMENSSYKSPNLPFSEDNKLSQYNDLYKSVYNRAKKF